MSIRLLNVWHIGAWNRNIGDWALAYHMHHLLNEQAALKGWHLNFYLVDGQRTYFHPELVDQLNAEADLVIIGGGGNLFHRPEDHSQSGWMLNISLTELDRVKKPIVVYGIGYNRFPFDPNEFPAITSRHLMYLQEKAQLFSARNHGSKKVMVEQFGLIPNKIDVIPDAGICLYDRHIEIPALNKKGPVIALNWAGDRPSFRYPEPAEQHMQRSQDIIKSALLRSVHELDAQIMFLPHLMGIDTEIYPDFAEGFPSRSIFSTHLELPFLYRPPGEILYANVPFFTNFFRQADLVLGMRAHTCILSFGAGTKFIPLGEHRKLAHFAADVGIPSDYVIPRLPLGPDAAAQVFGKIQSCLEDSSYQRLIETAHGKQMEILRSFNDRVLDVLA